MPGSIALGRGVRILAGLLLLLIGLILGTSAYHWYAGLSDSEKYPPPGTLYSIDNHAMHLYCLGSGSPVVMLEAGLTAGSSSWSQVHEPLSRVTKVCAYDRPGIDWSEPRPRGFNAKEVAANLARLLDAAGIREPLVLVGMSAGGVYVRQFQQLYPNRVAGLGLIDSSHEQQGWRLPKPEGADSVQSLLQLCARIAPLGLVRLSGVYEDLLKARTLAPALRERTLALLNRNHTCAATLSEMLSFEADVNRREPVSGLGDLPLVVISRGAAPDPAKLPPGYSLDFARRTDEVWQVLQRELAGLSTQGRQVMAAHSGHIIQEDEPEVVIRELTALVEALRAARPAPRRAPASLWKPTGSWAAFGAPSPCTGRGFDRPHRRCP